MNDLVSSPPVQKENALRCNVMAADCPSRKVIQHLTSRWALLVLVALLPGTRRFSSLRRHIQGVSERMLSQTLRTLEMDGMLLRQSMNTMPPHVEYHLTERGRKVADKFHELVTLIEETTQPDGAEPSLAERR